MNKRTFFFIVAVLAQMLILAAVPAQKIFAIKTGKTILLKTAPYDPYSIMSGYYVNLTYDISEPKAINWKHLPQGQKIWIVLSQGQNDIWHAQSVHKSRPKSIPEGCVVIKGKKDPYRIVYGIEAYFIPEKARHEIEDNLRKYQDQAKAEVKIDSFGNAAITKLIIRDQTYKY